MLSRFAEQVVDQKCQRVIEGFTRFANDIMTSKAGKKVLIVDDNALIATTLAQVLNFEGFNAFAAFSPKQALVLLHDGSFDVLISDVMMPEMTGIELTIRATEAHYVRSVPLMSGVSGTANLLRMRRSWVIPSRSLRSQCTHPKSSKDFKDFPRHGKRRTNAADSHSNYMIFRLALSSSVVRSISERIRANLKSNPRTLCQGA